ncbi:Hint domain-containing protein [Phaeobacter sp. PT47_59]|uniref:Hint domain-containing protein n=1 Tax=Phaeobacter sp. PT47_59 TaxID=3029979 RepID=UPI0023806482|nr:Hint domain-containing protein [Phaeobacter sp. PT47_59]MDE4174035.1 Hint domain-containing protein [Phaeobacter sp. PT47_59]
MPTVDIIRLAEDPRETAYGVRADTSSRGVDLEGAQITATYADGTSEVLTWKALDPYTNGGATGENIDMFFDYDWHELTTTKPLASLQIDLVPAHSVFDTTFAMDDDPSGGSTPSSLNGFPFKLAPEYESLSGNITATYTGIVNLSGAEAVGDLYTTMTLDFTGLPGGGLLGDLVWNTDIDTLEGPFDPTLVATDDLFQISGDGSEVLNVLENDSHGAGSSLAITHIAGQPVAAGGSVTLPSGEVVTLNGDGTLSITNDSSVNEINSFTYTVKDDLGNSDTGTVQVKTVVGPPPCFVAGTWIETELGPVPVEELEVGMRVQTRDHGLQPLRWIGRSRRRATGRSAPVVIAANALGRHDAIALSPNHRVLISSELAELLFGQSEVLVKAKHLVNDRTIRLRADGRPVTYVHLLFDQHEIICGNGLDSESYHPGAETLDAFDADTRAEVLELMAQIADYGPTARYALKAHESRLMRGT